MKYLSFKLNEFHAPRLALRNRLACALGASFVNLIQLRQKGLLRELNPGPLALEARIMPLDQAAIE